MSGLLLILALQTAALPASPAPIAQPERFSILVPAPGQPCIRQSDSDATVCADPAPPQRLAYPDGVGPRTPQPSNRELTGRGALEAQSAPCAVRLGGCQSSFGPPIVPMIVGAAKLIGGALKKKPDKTGRVAIPLDDSAAPTGRVER